MTVIVTKNSSTASAVPTTSDLVQGELAVNVTDKRIFTENASTQIVELGTNPSTITTATANVTGTLTANGTFASSNAVLTGGSINSTPIGATTPSTIVGSTITANTGFVGGLTGNVTGNLTGNVTGNVTGDLTGNVTGNLTAGSGTTTLNNLVVNGAVDFNAAVLSDLGSPVVSTDAATKGYVDTAVSNVIDAAPAALDTLNELAAALGDDANFSTTMTNSLAGKLNLSGGTMTGAIAMGTSKITGLGDPTAAQDAATKTYVDTADALKLNLSGGTMSGAIAMGTNKITSVGDPTLAQDAATKAYTDSILGSATSAADSAAAAATSASNASTLASFASGEADRAVAAKVAAAASYDAFDDRYLGQKASDPSVDNDGDALLTGALYFNTTDDKMKVYTGSAWADVSPTATSITVSQISDLTATATELNYTDGVTSAIQTQLDGKASTSSPTFTGTATADGLTVDGSAKVLGTAANTLIIADATETNGYQLKANTGSTVDYGFLIENLAGKDLLKVESNNDISFYEDTGTTPKFFWDASTERLGIGTASPTTLLNIASSSAPTLRIENTDDSLSQEQVVGALEFFSNDPSGKGPNVTGYIETRAADAVGAGGDMVFATGSTGVSPEGERAIERMRIDSSGNVGIGNATPATALDVTGTVTADGLVIDTDTLYVDSANNRVGIGTSSPDAKLTVSEYTNDTASALFYNTGGGSGSVQGKGYIGFGFSESWNFHGAEIGWDQEALSGYRQALTFSTRENSDVRPTERMRIDSSGNVGIGTSSPSEKLDVSGSVKATSYTEGVFAVTGTTPALSPTNGSIQTWTLSGNSTPTAGTWAEGQSITLMVDDGTAYTITWTSLSVTWKTDGGTAPTLNTTGDTAIALWKVGSTIYGARVGDA